MDKDYYNAEADVLLLAHRQQKESMEIKMKRATLFLFFSIFFVFTILAVRGAAHVSIGPRIVVDEPRYDFGEVNEDTIVSHDFFLMNRGRMPIEIVLLETSCDCLEAVSNVPYLLPQDGMVVAVRFDPALYDGNDPARAEARVIITTNYPQQRYVILVAEAKIVYD